MVVADAGARSGAPGTTTAERGGESGPEGASEARGGGERGSSSKGAAERQAEEQAQEQAQAQVQGASEMRRARPLVIGIAGGSGSGKTSISTAVMARLGSTNVSVVTHDCYYRDLKGLTFEERKAINFDHPDALETELLIEHLQKLRSGQAVGVPVYDFSTHQRRADETRQVLPTPVVIVDGILIFSDPNLRALFDIKVFVDTDADLRFIRRLKRDTHERGRSAEDVAEQYLSTVRPMHLQFVEPTKRFAHVIIPEGGYDSHVAMDMLVAQVTTAIAPAAAVAATATATSTSTATANALAASPNAEPLLAVLAAPAEKEKPKAKAKAKAKSLGAGATPDEPDGKYAGEAPSNIPGKF